MAKSILQQNKECFFSGRTDLLERHHVFGGSNRSKSERYGLTVWLNHYYHNEPACINNLFFGSPHHNREIDLQLKRFAQQKFEEKYSHELFMNEFGRNYL